MSNVAIPLIIMLGLGASAGVVAHRKIPGFWRASVVGGMVGMLLWIGGSLTYLALTEGLGRMDAASIHYLLKAVIITSSLTIPAAIAAGWLSRLRYSPAESKAETGHTPDR